MIKFVVLFCLVTLVTADNDPDAVNKLADSILGNLFKSKELNPLKFHQDYNLEVNEKILGPLTIHGTVKISKGELLGLNSLRRVGDVEMTNDESGNMLLKVDLITRKEIILDADFSANIGNIPPLVAIPIVAHIRSMNFILGVKVGQNLTLTEFVTNEISDVEIRLKDAFHLKAFDRIFDRLTAWFVKVFNEQVLSSVDQTMGPILAEELRYIHL